MKKVILGGLLGLALIGGVSTANAQGFKDKMKKLTAGPSFAHLNEVDDPSGISGEYTSLKPEEYTPPGGMKKNLTNFGFEYIKEEDGNIVNKMVFHYFRDKNYETYLKESWQTKHGHTVFYRWLYGSSYVEYVQLEEGVFAGCSVSNSIPADGKNAPADWERTVENVFAKDPAMLETYDLETAKAKVDMVMAALNAEALEKKKAEMQKYEAYKTYVGKIAFSDALATFNYRAKDKPTEDPKKFKKEIEMGQQIYWRAYLDKPLVVTHPGAWYNISYELNGKKTDREGLRGKSSFYSKNIKRKDSWMDAYTTWVHSLIEKQNGFDVWDYAFIDLLYQNKADFKVGQSYELTVTIHAYKDGENLADLASGKVQLKYTEESEKLMNKADTGILTRYEKYLNE